MEYIILHFRWIALLILSIFFIIFSEKFCKFYQNAWRKRNDKEEKQISESRGMIRSFLKFNLTTSKPYENFYGSGRCYFRLFGVILFLISLWNLLS